MTKQSEERHGLTIESSQSWRVLTTAAVAIGMVSGLVLFLIWWNLGSTDQKKLAVEAGKTLMQVIGVVLLGAVLSYAANSVSMKFQGGMTARQLLHTSVEAERVRMHSDWQRQADQQKDERVRQDELRRALLEATIANYNAVKRARRRLRAEGYRGPGADQRDFVPGEQEKAREVFVDAFERIIEAQLEFERLEKTAELAGVWVTKDGKATDIPTAEDAGTNLGLDEIYAKCARYLNAVLDDYVNKAIPEPGPQRAEALGRFLAHRTEERGFGEFSANANAAMKVLREILTKPLEVTPERDFSINMAKVEAEWRHVLVKAPFSKARGR